MALAEANAELDLKISTLTSQLMQANQQLEETRYGGNCVCVCMCVRANSVHVSVHIQLRF